MMQPEDRLDALLSGRRAASYLSGRTDLDGSLTPMLAVVDDLTPLATATPDAAFADALEARLLEQTGRLASLGTGTTATTSLNGHAQDVPRRLGVVPTARARRAANTEASWRRKRVLWPAVAAALLLVGTSGTLTVAAHASPGTPLFGVRELEQQVQVSLTTSAVDRVRLHLTYASDALDALDAAVAQQSGDPAYSSALAALRSEDAAAADGIADLAGGSDRDTLTQQLADLRVREKRDLRAALPALDWSHRIATTSALGQAGDTVLVVTSTTSTAAAVQPGQGEAEDGSIRLVVVHGAGFQPGAVLLINGTPSGTVTALSPTTLEARVDARALDGGRVSIGVGNPDGTAAAAPHQKGNDGGDGSGSHGTPTPGTGHGGDDGSGGDKNGGAGGSHGGDHNGTPTPSPTQTPGSGH